MWGVEWAVVLAMILFNSVFAAYEIALASVALARLQILVREKRPGAKAALEMKERMEASLAVVQVGITLVGAIGAAASGAGALEMISPWFQSVARARSGVRVRLGRRRGNYDHRSSGTHGHQSGGGFASLGRAQPERLGRWSSRPSSSGRRRNPAKHATRAGTQGSPTAGSGGPNQRPPGREDA